MNAPTQRDLSAHDRLRSIFQQARLPVMAAPMFLVSSPEMVSASQRAGIVGTYAAPNARTVADLDIALGSISQQATAIAQKPEHSGTSTPWALNMIVHRSYDRFDAEMELVERYQPGIVTTALGSPARVLARVHNYGGMVVADVISPSLARKAVDAGVDGLILVTSGAGGHTGRYHPFAFLSEVRRFWDGPIGLAGAISSGEHIRAAQMLGADFVVIGTRLIATPESMASAAYRDLVVASDMEDLVLSSAVSGVSANWLRGTLDAAGFTDEQLNAGQKIDFSGDIAAAPKAWKDVWSAGHGVGSVSTVAPVAQIVDELHRDYLACLRTETTNALRLSARYAPPATQVAQTG